MIDGQKNMNTIFVSVIMSTYNESEKDLILSIESILNQIYTDFEFIIINDNPTSDDLRTVLEKYRQQDHRIRILTNEQNLGLVKSLNKGWQAASGTYIARMDADDIAEFTRLADQLNYIRKNHLDLVGSWIRVIDEDNMVIDAAVKFPVKDSEIKKRIVYGSCLAHPTWMIKRSVYESLNGYRLIHSCEDYDFILRAIKAGYKFGNIPKIELNYRIRSNGISVTNSNKQYLLRRYLVNHRKNILSIEQIDGYLESEQYKNDLGELEQFQKTKEKLKESASYRRPLGVLRNGADFIFNRYFFLYVGEKRENHKRLT